MSKDPIYATKPEGRSNPYKEASESQETKIPLTTCFIADLQDELSHFHPANLT